jgi:regulatory protein
MMEIQEQFVIVDAGYVRRPYESFKIEWSNGSVHYLPIDAASPASCRSGAVHTQDEYNRYDALHAELAAWQGALRRLERSACTTRELLLYLKRKGYDQAIAQMIVERAVALGMIDDQSLANRLAERKFHSQGKGRLRVKMELQAKGISSAQIHEATAHLQEDDEYVMAWNWAQKRWPTVKGEGKEKAFRMARQLQQRGYSSAVVRKILQQLRVNLDNEEEESLQ